MKLFSVGKDGGAESKVKGFWLIEVKKLFSIVLLRFDGDSREAYHSHAFNSISWLLSGRLSEINLDNSATIYSPSITPIFTYRDTFHKVNSKGHSWALSFRGPWCNEWEEFLPNEEIFIKLTHGRNKISH